MAFSGVVTLVNLILCLIVGMRLLWAGSRSGRRPELALAVYLLASAFLATVFQGIVYGAMVDPQLAVSEGTSRVILGSAILGMAIGGAAVCAFTWMSFRRHNRWAMWATIAGSLLAMGGYVFEALNEGFAIMLMPGPGHWCAWAGRTAPMVWLTAESFAYWAKLRRRERLGLADPTVVNRFLLWGVWSAATLVNFAADFIARVVYALLAGTTEVVVMDAIRPVVIGTMAVTMVLGIVSAGTLFLTFFPPARYRHWLESRAELRQAA